MPGSLLNTSPSTGIRHSIVHRSDSNRSDRSEASAYSSEGGSSKKVSFNKAVRVKKYTTPPISPIDISENKFWFKVYKTQQYKPESSHSVASQFDEPEEEHNSQRNDPSDNNVRPLSTIVESGDSSSSIPTPEMSRRVLNSKYDSSPISSKPRVRNISNDSNVEVIKPKDTYYKYRDYSVPHERDVSPSMSSASAKNSVTRSHRPQEPEIDYINVDSRSNSPSKMSKTGSLEPSKMLKTGSLEPEKQPKRNPIVNGVKVIFGMSPSMPKKGKNQTKLEQTQPVHTSHSNGSPIQTTKRFGSPDRSKSNKLDLYTAPSRNANLTNRKLHSSDNRDIALKTKNINTNKSLGEMSSNSKSNNRKKDEAYSDIGNETSALDEVINNAKLDLVPRTDSDEEHQRIDSVQIIPIEVWRSGPRLMNEKTDFKKSLTEIPGEGKTFSSQEQGSKVWQNKTRRKYYEIVPKQNKENRRTDVKAIEDINDNTISPKMIDTATDDEKIVSVNELDDMFLEKTPKQPNDDYPYTYSYIPTVRDVGIQCNRKKTNRHLLKNSINDNSYRIIKSSNDGLVTAYSDVPQLRPGSPSQRTPVSKHEVWDEDSSLPQSEAIYSQIDKTKKKSFKNDVIRHNYDEEANYPAVIYRTPLNERRPPTGVSPHSGSRFPGSEYSTNTNRTIKNKTTGFGFTLSSGVDGPKIELPKIPPSPKLRGRSITRYEEPVNDWNDRQPRDGFKREVKQEILEETISISNASSEDLMQNYQNTDIDEFLAPKSVIKELDHKRKEISYVNVSPNQRKLRSGDAYEGATTNGGGMWLRDIDEDYRRGMAQNEVSHPAANEPTFATLSRLESKNRNSEPRDFSPPPRQAYTLDRRHLKERQKRLESLSSAKSKDHNNTNERHYRSHADITEQLRNDDTRGGLAAAYKNRQERRTSSLNRMTAVKDGRKSPSYSTPRNYLSHSHLNSAGNSAHSSSDSDTLNRHKRQYVHDREPIVMYIPAVSHHNKRAEDEPDRLSGILRRNSVSSKHSAKIKRPPKTSASSDITPTKPRDYSSGYPNYSTLRPNHDEEMDEIVELRDTKQFGKDKKGKKNGLSRRHSIPKDTKFPWLQKLKFKVKSKEP